MSFTKNFNKGRGVLAAASRLNASMENIAPTKEEKLNLSQEGIAGWLGGFLVSAGATLTTTIPFLNTGIAAGASAAIVNLRKDINHIGKEIAKVRQQATEEAYKDGKIPEVVYKAEKAINVGDVGTVLLGALFGTIPVVNWFYNAGSVSKLQDLSKELEEKTKELEDLVAANSKPGVSQENLDEKLNLSQEAMSGRVIGFILGTIPFANTAMAVSGKKAAEQLKSEITQVSTKIANLKKEAAAEAKKEGKIPEEVYQQEAKISATDIVLAAIYGTIPIVSSFYNASKMSKLQDLEKELLEKTKELNAMTNEGGQVSQEDLDEKLEGAVDEGNEENAEGVKATDVTGSEEKQPEAAAPAAAETVPAEVQETVNLDETLEEVAEVEEAGEEVAADVEKTDDLITDQETLVSLADELDEQADNGGAEPETIRAVEIAVEGIITRMQGGRRPTRVTPSLESFGGVRSKVVSTRLAAESIREWAAAAGNAIAEFFKKILEGIKALFAKLTGSTADMKKQIALLTNEVKASENKEGTLKISSSVAARLKLGGKVSKEALFAGIARMRKFVQAMLRVFKANKETAQGVNLDALAGSPEEVKIKTATISNEIKRLGKVSEKTEDGAVTVTYLEELPGDITVDLSGPDIVEIDGKYYRAAASLDVTIESPATESEDDEVELRRLTKEETEKILSELSNLVGEVEELETPVKETEGVISGFFNWIKSAGNSAKEGTRSGWEAAKGFAQRMAASAARSLSTVVRFVAGYVYAVLAFIKSAFASNKPKAIGMTPAKLK